MNISQGERGGNGVVTHVVNIWLIFQDARLLNAALELSLAIGDGFPHEVRNGRVAEWFKAPVLKTGVPARAPWVRIPPLPPVCCSPLFAVVRNPQLTQWFARKRCT